MWQGEMSLSVAPSFAVYCTCFDVKRREPPSHSRPFSIPGGEIPPPSCSSPFLMLGGSDPSCSHTLWFPLLITWVPMVFFVNLLTNTHEYLLTCGFLTHRSESSMGTNLHESGYSSRCPKNLRIQIWVTHE